MSYPGATTAKRKICDLSEKEIEALKDWYIKERRHCQKYAEKLANFTILSSQDPPRSSDDEKENSEPEQEIELFFDATEEFVTFIIDKFESKDVRDFLRFLESNQIISKFLKVDYCRRRSDNYLLATVFIFFKRIESTEFTTMKFFQLLYLAIEMEEDDDEVKYDILPWALGKRWRTTYVNFINRKDELWKKMNFKSVVSIEAIKAVMAVEDGHPCWQRFRSELHSGAVPAHLKYSGGSAPKSYLPREPHQTPEVCVACLKSLPAENVPTMLASKRRKLVFEE